LEGTIEGILEKHDLTTGTCFEGKQHKFQKNTFLRFFSGEYRKIGKVGI